MRLFIYRSYEIITASYFCVRHKSRREHNQHFKLLIFQAFLHFGTSHLLSTYRKTSLILIISFHLFLSSIEIQRTVIQTKYTTGFFPLSEKKRLLNLQKQQLQKNIFSSVHVMVTTCFDKCFLFHVITERHCFYTLRSLQC